MIMGVPESELEDKIVALGIKKVEDDSSGKPLYDVNDFKGI
ncbi:hypothetical protein FACS1894200_02550 [Spirochaetia bacterium]|nr:hypothetical protein FACS1894200_02550 [Spirochaetia bacterium]